KASLALGKSANANNDNDVALGSGSQTAAANPTASTTINGTIYDFAGTNPQSVVSVGRKDNERQITNVAAGQVNENSTDAINGSQLHATNEALEETQDTVDKGLSFAGDTGDTVQRDLGETLNVKGGASGTLTTGNIGVTGDEASGTLS